MRYVLAVASSVVFFTLYVLVLMNVLLPTNSIDNSSAGSMWRALLSPLPAYLTPVPSDVEPLTVLEAAFFFWGFGISIEELTFSGWLHSLGLGNVVPFTSAGWSRWNPTSPDSHRRSLTAPDDPWSPLTISYYF